MISEFGPGGDERCDVDREIRIAKMRRDLDELSGGAMIIGRFRDGSPSLDEAFLEEVCEFEKAEQNTNFNRLVQLGVEITSPSKLDDVSLEKKLHEVIGGLVTIRCFLEQTDHLSDRELYEWLWSDGLREETPDLTQIGGAWHMSPIGSSNDEDTVIFLTYYASEKERERWQEEFPRDALPPRHPLPYDRDRNLPRPESQ
jgi:hypothetical protein